jgi:hypothetical protein
MSELMSRLLAMILLLASAGLPQVAWAQPDLEGLAGGQG